MQMIPLTGGKAMKINHASRSTGISRDMIRYYDNLGLVTPVHLPPGSGPERYTG